MEGWRGCGRHWCGPAIAMAFVGAACEISSHASSHERSTESGGTVASCSDAAADFSSGLNPNGPWSYGWSAGAFLQPAFTMYTEFGSGLNGWAESADQVQWTAPGARFPVAWLNTADAVRHPGGTTTVQPHQLVLHPGPAGEFSTARWIAPITGKVIVKAFFEGVAGYANSPVTSAVLHVQHNGLEIAAGILNLDDAGNSFAWESTVDLAARDTLDFLVGDGNESYLPDSTALSAIICY